MTSELDMVNLYIDLMKKVLTATIYDQNSWGVNQSRKNNYFRKLLSRYLKSKSMLLINTNQFSKSAMEEGRGWSIFGFTMVGHRRLDNVQLCLDEVLKNNIPGDLVETGSWRGGTTIFMRALLKAYNITDRKVWVADSFEGLPVPKNQEDGKDLSNIDYLKVPLEQVKLNFEKFNLLDEQVEFIKGWFCDSLPKAPIDKIAILRLDGDLYSSTMDSLENLYHKVSKGGFIIVDDYYSWPSCRKAVTDFLESNSLQPEIKKIDWTGAYWQI